MSKKKKRNNSQRKNEITKGIFSVLEEQPKKSFNYKQLAAKLHINDTEGRNLLIKKLGQLQSKKRIIEEDKGSFKALGPKAPVKGRVDITARGNAYVIVDGMDDDIFVPYNKLRKAFHGDIVEVVTTPRRNSRKIEGEIVAIIERKKNSFVGIVDLKKTFAFVRTTDFRMYTDIFVPIDRIGSARDGEKVVVRIEDWPEDADSPFGEIIEVLGIPGEHDTEIHSILAEYGLPYSFPPEVTRFADTLDTSIKEGEIAKRRDMRNTLTFTIDPRDAKDFDDALSFEILDNGNYEIGIHIADVSHYLIPETILDDEAYDRATSVYLVDRVVPMLPEILSNDACSLRPNEDKYTFSAIFEIDKDARVQSEWFGRTVINSDERFAYEEAQQIIDTAKGRIPTSISIRGEAYSVTEEVVTGMLTLNRLAIILRRARMSEGAISFDKVEVKFLLNDANEPQSVYFKEAREANKLIEEFMLLANRKVAEFIGKQRPVKTFIYRVHDEPDEEKLFALNSIISRFGHQINFRNKKTVSESLNKLLEDVKGQKEQNLVDTLTIRSMSKAIYTTDNIGHYGLSFDYYTHFTSPIRRYPDVMVHRLLQHYLEGGGSAKSDAYEARCRHASNMENLAASAERDSIKYMQIKFMQDHRDAEFIGVISGVTEWGIYVEIIENKCEGMVRIKDIKDDYYTFDEREYAIVGERTKKVYQLGDEVRVRVRDTNLVKRHLDFTLLGKHN